MQRPLALPSLPHGWLALAAITVAFGLVSIIATLAFGANEDHFWQGVGVLVLSSIPISHCVAIVREPVYPRVDVVAGTLHLSAMRSVRFADLGELTIEKRVENGEYIYSHGLHAQHLDRAITVEWNGAHVIARKKRLEQAILAHAYRRLLATPQHDGTMRSVDVGHEMMRLAGHDGQRASFALNCLLLDEHDPAIRRRATSVKLA